MTDLARAIRKNLLTVATAYAKASKLSLASVSRKFHGNQAFLKTYRSGRCSVTVDKLGEMIEGFRREWPQGAKWPELAPIEMGTKIPVDGPGAK